MEAFVSLIQIWLMHAGLVAVLTAPIVFFGRKRVHWQWWELTVLILPFGLWFILGEFDLSRGKSLANLVEIFYFGLSIPLAALVRVALGRRCNERICSGILIGVVCLIAVGTFFLVPSLPE